jgi:hypothetical protein
VSKVKDLLLSGLVLVVGRGRRSPRSDATRVVPKFDSNPGAETAAILLLFLAALCCAGFLVVYGVEAIPHKTQYLGLSLGLALICIAASLTIVAHKLVVTEELVEEYPPEEHVGEVELIAEVVEESGDRFTRRRLFKLGLLAAGGGLVTAGLAPALSFGPLLRVKSSSARRGHAAVASSTSREGRTTRRTSRRRTSTRRSPRGPTRRSSVRPSCSCGCPCPR